MVLGRPSAEAGKTAPGAVASTTIFLMPGAKN
jgi:hypothetical protein